jgi:hypothetical protein
VSDSLADPRYRHPHAGVPGRLIETVLGWSWWPRLRRAVLSRLPFVTLASDVRDVVYLNWLVDVARIAHLVPPGLRVWQREGRTVLTVLSYRHGGFGPAFAGPGRRWFGSPRQSNWRLYLVDDDRTGAAAAAPASVLFLGNSMDSALYTLGARLFSDALPTHLAASFVHEHRDGRYRTEIEPGCGSASALRYQACRDTTGTLPPGFAPLFAGVREAIRVLALQDRAVARCADGAGLAEAGIDLPVPIEEAQPLQLVAGSLHAPDLAPILADAPVFCFAVPRVPFRVLWERLR